jgi:hypothetical protein
MSESNGDKMDWLSFAQRHGALLNQRGGYYRQGKQYGMEKKNLFAVEVAQFLVTIIKITTSHRDHTRFSVVS